MNWKKMSKAPKDKRILIKTDSGEIYAADFAINPETSAEAYKVADLPDGSALVITDPQCWMPLPPGCA
jgi:hypothetical protein